MEKGAPGNFVVDRMTVGAWTKNHCAEPKTPDSEMANSGQPEQRRSSSPTLRASKLSLSEHSSRRDTPEMSRKVDHRTGARRKGLRNRARS